MAGVMVLVFIVPITVAIIMVLREERQKKDKATG